MSPEPATPPADRVLPTTGIHNFRDYGGYAVADGGALRRGVLYRSGQHAEATDADLALVDQIGIRAVFDLRGKGEREHSPCRRSAQFSARVYCAGGETAQSAPHTQAATAVDGAAARQIMCRRYAEVPYRPFLMDVYRDAFSVLASSTGPTLMNCTAGKDRTGVLVALVQSALGVHPDDIMEDYLLTNSAGDAESRVEALRQDLQRRFGAGITEDAIRVVTSVEPAFLASAFQGIRKRSGSVDAYLQQEMALPPAARAAMMVRLVAAR
ncbi:MAG: hypothetical protein RIR41_1804 [Pseudomonadota bacterium]